MLTWQEWKRTWGWPVIVTGLFYLFVLVVVRCVWGQEQATTTTTTSDAATVTTVVTTTYPTAPPTTGAYLRLYPSTTLPAVP